jgi:redox-sensitive bicupin YhaK (pirin superfamily)
MSPLLRPQPVTVTRTVEQLISGQCSRDADGVELKRLLTQNLQARLSPFLMFEAFARQTPEDCGAGLTDHPHRGFELVSYMIAGRLLHRQSGGQQRLLESGGVHWSCAGRGAIHAKLAQPQDGRMEGFQLWINLPQRDKMGAPWSRDFAGDELGHFALADGVAVTVIAGQSHGVNGAVTRLANEPLYLDLHLPAGSRLAQPLPAAHNAFIYVYRGKVTVAGREVQAQRMAILTNSRSADGVTITATEDARVLLLAGQPLAEPIAQYRTFVMNTQKEIYRALTDYRDGCLCESASESASESANESANEPVNEPVKKTPERALSHADG